MRVDLGSHRLHPSIDPEILGVLRALLGDDLQRRERNGRIRLGGRFLSFPLKPGELFTRMPPAFAAGAARDLVTSPFRRSGGGDFASVLRAGLGKTICERFYFPYARKIWGVEPEELATEQARRRVSASSPVKILARALRGSGTGGERGSAFFYYPRRGYGQLWDELARAAAARGVDVRYGVTAASVTPGEEHVVVESEDGEVFTAEQVFSTLPVTVLARIAGAPAPVLEAAGRLRFRSMLLVYLVLDVERFTPFDAHYLPEAVTPVTRVSEPKNYRESGDDPAGRTVLCAEIPCDLGDPLWDASVEELGGVVIEGLAASGLPAPVPAATEVRRLPFAYPIYLNDYAPNFEVLDRWAEGLERVLTFGRQGLFAHDNAHHALSMAWEAAGALGEGGVDRRSWAAARERFADHVVED